VSMRAFGSFMPAAMLVLLPACSGGVREGGSAAIAEKGDAARIVPEGLSVTALAGGNGVLDVTALTLRKGASSVEVYAALKNDGEIPACTAAFSVELFDQTGRSLAAGIGGLLTRHFYRLKDGSGSIAACVSPGDVTIAAITDLPADIAVDQVKTIVYRCPYYALEVDPIDGLDIDDMKSVSRDGATTYTGTLVNDLDVAVTKPSVTVFPVNRVGRPLGMAIGSSSHEIPPHGRWTFETSSVDAAVVDYAAYPTGAIHP
jgi:hypothetical protein